MMIVNAKVQVGRRASGKAVHQYGQLSGALSIHLDLVQKVPVKLTEIAVPEWVSFGPGSPSIQPSRAAVQKTVQLVLEAAARLLVSQSVKEPVRRNCC